MNSADRMTILTAGGTIDKHHFDAPSHYRNGESAIAKLLEFACVGLPLDIIEVVRKDCLGLDDVDRARLVRAAHRCRSKRIVVTHSTNMMTLSAAALAVIPQKTIVLTGAFTPACFTNSDAAFNLGMAIAAAQLAPPGVYIAINGTVFRGDGVSKDRDNTDAQSGTAEERSPFAAGSSKDQE